MVKAIPSSHATEWLRRRHYAHRLPSISYAFAVFIGPEPIGVCTFGQPASLSLCKGICGPQYRHLVLELNRLCVEDDAPKNTSSYLVGRALRALPKPAIVVSYADSAQRHVGYIYQATNWLYTGKTTARTDIATPNGQHSRHYEKGGDYSKRIPRSSKHRYIYFHACTPDIVSSLRYPLLPYPKGDTVRYDATANIGKQGALL